MIPHNKSIRQPELLLGYGYTGHEHLPWFGLINMNARLYDPATGRFLNPDPVVQLPDNTQSYNRYSYCLNNPLRYTDPTGLFESEHYDVYGSDGNLVEDIWVVYLPNVEVYGSGTFSVNWSMRNDLVNGRDKTFVLPTLTNGPTLHAPIVKVCGGGASYGASRGNSESRKSAYIDIIIEASQRIVEESKATYTWLKRNTPQLIISTKGSKKIYGHTGHRVAGLARGIGWLGKALTISSVYNDIKKIQASNDLGDQIDYGFDAFMNGLGIIDNTATLAISIGWSMGGNELFYKWREEVLMPQVEDGTAGLMINQPSK